MNTASLLSNKNLNNVINNHTSVFSLGRNSLQ